MMEFVDVYEEPKAAEVLYNLLQEREPNQSIMHKELPSFDDHVKFVVSKPYLSWYLLKQQWTHSNAYVGSVYLTRKREIGIFIFKDYQGKGFAMKAIDKIRNMYPGEIYANVNPENIHSIKLFSKIGKVIQHTFKLEET